jgi:hypothetical protein
MADKPLATRGERVLDAASKVAALGFGGYVSNEMLTEISGYKADSKQFGFFVSDVREVLVERGMWLSGD